MLRDGGFEISTDELITLDKAVPWLDFSSPSALKEGLQALLLRDGSSMPLFNRIIDSWLTGTVEDQGEVQQMLILMAEEMLDQSPETSREDLEEQLMSVAMDGSGGDMEGNSITQELSRKLIKKKEGDQGKDERLSSMVQTAVIQVMERRNSGRREAKKEDTLLTKPIYRLDRDEINEMRDVVKRLAQKLKSRVRLRQRKHNRGRIDIRRTMRASLQYNGIPMDVHFIKKRRDRPDLVVLCDVSGSVNQYNRFMLLFTHSLQQLFSKVYTFAFVSKLVNISLLMREMDPERAMASVINDKYFTYGFGTNYGQAFTMLMDEHSDKISSRTTVIILGDARNNNQGNGLEYFKTISRKCRNIYWLNPEKKHLWDWGDSIASQYQPFCTSMREIQNVKDLWLFMDSLLGETLR
jgi:uncharacterized protein